MEWMFVGTIVGMILLFSIIAFLTGADIEKNDDDVAYLKTALAILIIVIIGCCYCYGLGYLVKEREINEINTEATCIE